MKFRLSGIHIISEIQQLQTTRLHPLSTKPRPIYSLISSRHVLAAGPCVSLRLLCDACVYQSKAMSANESTPPHAAQMIAFRKLVDTDNSCFRQDLRAPEALQALREYNTAAPTSITASALAAPGPSAGDTTIFQGTCLVYAYLEQEQLLRPAWNGVPCALALDTVRTFTNFRGSFREERKVRLTALIKLPYSSAPVSSGDFSSCFPFHVTAAAADHVHGHDNG